MAILTKGTTFADGEQVTSTRLNNLVDSAAFVAGSSGTTDDVTLQVTGGGQLAVKTVNTGQIANSAVTTAKIADANVTPAKLSNSDFGDFTVSAGVATIDNSAVTTAKIADSSVTFAKLSLPSNFPIQVVQAVKTDTQTITSTTTSWTDITNLSLTLTRAIASASGKVRVQANVSSSSNNGNHGVALRIVRDSTVIDAATGDASGNRLRATSNGGYNGSHSNESSVIDFIDSSPGSASTVTYKIQAKVYSPITGYINRSNSDTDAGDYSFRTISTLTLTELAP
jgi:hypothetical protein